MSNITMMQQTACSTTNRRVTGLFKKEEKNEEVHLVIIK